MAIPTISSITPSTGPSAGGSLIDIVGTNFKIPTLSYAVPTPSNITPTVRVTIGGRAARRVEVVSATHLRVLTPRYWHQDPRVDQFAAVDVVISNLSSSGVVIPGETVTSAGGYTYARWVLGAPRQDSPLTRILTEFVQALALEIERNTYVATNIDYGEEGVATIISEANLPSINLQVSVQRDVEMAQFDNYYEEIDQDADTADIYEGARTVMLVVDMLLAGNTIGESFYLVSAVQDFVQVNPQLEVTPDPTLFPTATDTDLHPVEIWKDAQLVGSAGRAGLVVYSMQLRVRGIRTLPDDPIYSAKKIDTFTLTFNHLSIRTGASDGTPVHVNL